MLHILPIDFYQCFVVRDINVCHCCCVAVVVDDVAAVARGGQGNDGVKGDVARSVPLKTYHEMWKAHTIVPHRKR